MIASAACVWGALAAAPCAAADGEAPGRARVREVEALRDAGQLVEARSRARACAGDAEGDARAACGALADALEGRVPTVRIAVSGGAAGVELAVRIDGARVPVDGAPIAVDPGAHRIEVDAPGFVAQQRALSIAAGERREVGFVLVPTPNPAAERRGPAAFAWVGAGVAALGLGTGLVAGTMSLQDTRMLALACPARACPEAERGTYDAARAEATVASVAFVVGGVGLAVAILGVLLDGGHAARSMPAPRVSAWAAR